LPIHEFIIHADPKPEQVSTYEKALDMFLTLGVNINEPLNDNGETLLHAVTSVAMFKLLVSKEANATATTRYITYSLFSLSLSLSLSRELNYFHFYKKWTKCVGGGNHETE